MTYVIYVPQTDPNDFTPILQRLERPNSRSLAKHQKCHPEAQMTTLENFEKNIVTKIKIKNMMNGAEVEVTSDTPYTCTVASETYWSS